jgi:hypothetical protein
LAPPRGARQKNAGPNPVYVAEVVAGRQLSRLTLLPAHMLESVGGVEGAAQCG